MGEAVHEENILPVSYHTFIYPFSYEEAKDGETLDSYIDMKISQNKTAYWRKADNKDEDQVLLYNAYQYFLPKARNVLFPDAEKDENHVLVNRYVYNLSDKPEIQIELNDNETYVLSIGQISLEIVKEHRIGILTFELENYTAKSEEEIIKINEYGRRVFAACVGNNDNEPLKSLLTARGLKISGVHLKNNPEKPFLEIYFNEEFKDGVKKLKPTISLAENIIFEGLPEGKWENCILPVLDDRMYAVCLMRKNYYPPIIREFGKYRYLNNQEYAEQLYKFIFLESGDSTCRNVDMMREKLKEHVYRRWTDTGTVYGVTEYSCVCVTGIDFWLRKAVINPFLTIYVPMVKLVLLQRSAITKMEKEAQKVSQDLGKGKSVEIKSLWQKYVLFQNTLLIPQATFQEQGVELYDMLVKFLKIKEMNAYLEDELQNLFNYAQMDKNELEKERAEGLDKKLNIITIIGTLLAAGSLMQDIYASLAVNLFGSNTDAVTTGFLITKLVLYVVVIAVIYHKVLKTKDSILEDSKSFYEYFKFIFIWLIALLWMFILAEALLLKIGFGNLQV